MTQSQKGQTNEVHNNLENSRKNITFIISSLCVEEKFEKLRMWSNHPPPTHTQRYLMNYGIWLSERAATTWHVTHLPQRKLNQGVSSKDVHYFFVLCLCGGNLVKGKTSNPAIWLTWLPRKLWLGLCLTSLINSLESYGTQAVWNSPKTPVLGGFIKRFWGSLSPRLWKCQFLSTQFGGGRGKKHWQVRICSPCLS